MDGDVEERDRAPHQPARCFTIQVAAVGLGDLLVNFAQQVLGLLQNLVDEVVEGSRVGQGQVGLQGLDTVPGEGKSSAVPHTTRQRL